METFPHAFVPLFCSLKIELTFFFDGNLNESGLFPDLRGIHSESLLIYFYFFCSVFTISCKQFECCKADLLKRSSFELPPEKHQVPVESNNILMKAQ